MREHFGFGIDAQRVGNAVDVIEVGNHLDRIENVAVIKPVLTEGVDILFADGGRSSGHQIGEFCQGLAARRKLCTDIVALDLFGQLWVTAFPTEILSVSFDSIEAVVGPGDNDGQQLALGARQPGGSVHGGQVQAH